MNVFVHIQAGPKLGVAMLHGGIWIAGGNEAYTKLYGNVDTANPKWGEIKGSTGLKGRQKSLRAYDPSQPAPSGENRPLRLGLSACLLPTSFQKETSA